MCKIAVFLCMVAGALAFSPPSASKLPLASLRGSQMCREARPLSSLRMGKQAPAKSVQQALSPSQANTICSKLAPACAAFTSLFGIAGGLPAAFAVSLIASAVGFISAVYFVGYGYALSMIALGSVTLQRFMATASQPAVYHAVGVIAWGARILTFLLYREFFAWKQLKERNRETNKKFAFTAKVSTWLFVSIFYALLFSPVLFHLQAASSIPVLTKTGLGVAAVGLLIESQSDAAKSSFKQSSPESFMSSGLYRFCRHPNYFGEVIFWGGSYAAGVGSLTSPLAWTSASLGMAGIVAIMLQATESLEKKQALKYAELPEYAEYVKSTPKLIPFTGGDELNEIVVAAQKAQEAKEKAAAEKAKAEAEAAERAKQQAAEREAKAKLQAAEKAKREADKAARKAAAKGPQAGVPKKKMFVDANSPYLENKKPWDP